jgi:EAL and modified HD-GYP domain-containing signal transduction protein
METFIARQPIFTRQKKVFAYELLYRSGAANNFCTAMDLNEAANKVIADSGLLPGLGNLTDGKKAFINVTREVLLDGVIEVLPKELTVVELLETIEPDAEVIAACKKLREAGYLLALDDFVYAPRFEPLVELSDIIKVDFLSSSREERAALARRGAQAGIHMLAEKVETHEAFSEAVELGYSYFQGYFFCRPVILAHRDVPGNKLQYLRILQEIQRPEINLEQIERIIRRDLALTFKLLRYLNSAAFNFKNEIETIRQALMLLGERQIRKWASLVIIASLGQDKPEELVRQALIRARFCETLGPLLGLGHRAEDLFLTGMMSLIDAILDHPLEQLLKDLPLNSEIRDALTGHENRLSQVYSLTVACERGDWETLARLTAQLGVSGPDLLTLYLSAVEWATQSYQGTAAEQSASN